MKKLKQRVPIYPLLYFRIMLGLLLIQLLVRYFYYDWIHKYYIEPTFFFSHFNWNWLTPLPGYGMYILFLILLVLAIFILLGIFTRLSALLFALGFSYQHLIDKSNFLNHYYLVFLLTITLFLIQDASSNNRNKIVRVPRWSIWLVRFQLGIVYIFGAIAKMRPDWIIHAQPLKIWLLMNRDMPIIGPALVWNITPYLFSYAGLIFDLFIFPFLLLEKTRKPAYFVVLFFHILTFSLFPIGMFPWIMVFLTPVCFSNRFHYRFILIIRKIVSTTFKLIGKLELATLKIPLIPVFEKGSRKDWNLYLAIVFCILQILIPLRHFFFPGNLLWTEEGFRFSWHIMAAHKSGMVQFFIREENKEKLLVSYNQILTQRQLGQMTTDPAMIWQFANYIYKEEEKKGRTNFGVFAHAYISLNNRKAVLMIDPEVDLHKAKYEYFRPTQWILPLQEVIR